MDEGGIGYELLAVDDGSTDPTLARWPRGAGLPAPAVIHFPRNGGTGTVADRHPAGPGRDRGLDRR